jgi:hypothetical protein
VETYSDDVLINAEETIVNSLDAHKNEIEE